MNVYNAQKAGKKNFILTMCKSVTNNEKGKDITIKTEIKCQSEFSKEKKYTT